MTELTELVTSFDPMSPVPPMTTIFIGLPFLVGCSPDDATAPRWDTLGPGISNTFGIPIRSDRDRAALGRGMR